ncbi:hypothetical protein NliqN6_2405 [Naganishia liquefaciens]|uniref:Uncharacterized protein n=1 Tax=Naganishia liquefaciens TaxID=104408 RepID=A0A8H3YE86_9TREE|nr:hypothetical protein NliqN6_2405 [Naganishia liquefaciens]
MRHPHQAHLYSTGGSTVIDRASAVSPILQDDARFDIAATIWYSLPRDVQAEDNDKHEANEEEKTLMRYWGAPLADLRPIPKQEAILSEIVIRNASFQDKNLYRRVHYRLPLDRFRQQNLTGLDLRATFVLLPLNSDRFNQITNFSDWRPADLQIPENIPTSSPALARYGSNSVYNDLLQRWAVSTTLLRFYDTSLQCFPTDEAEQVSQNSSDISCSDSVVMQSNQAIDAGTATEPDLKAHPHVLTRSHILVIKETRPYNLSSFADKHLQLRQDSCKHFATNLPRHYRFCSKKYADMGEFGLQVDFASADGTTETGYLPFIGALQNPAGPKEIVPLPVNQRICGRPANAGIARSRENHLDIAWDIQFSAISAGRANLLTGFASPIPEPPKANATQRQIAQAQDEWEQQVGLLGHRTEGAHPRTRLLTSALTISPLLLITYLLDCLYWYSRTTLVGLDVWATACSAAAMLLETFPKQILDQDAHGEVDLGLSSAVQPVLIFILWLLFALPAFHMLRAISPFCVTWTSWTTFTLERSRQNHRERTSNRVANQLAPAQKLATIVLVWIGVILISILDVNFYIIAPATMEPVKGKTIRIIVSSLEFSLLTCGILFQMIMNQRCSTFAGRTRSAAVIWAFTSLLWVVRLSPYLIGKRNPTYSFRATESITLILDLCYAYQALTLPVVEQKPWDEEEE